MSSLFLGHTLVMLLMKLGKQRRSKFARRDNIIHLVLDMMS